MELYLAVLWTFILGLTIGSAILGGTPTWVIVFGPLITLVVEMWIQYFKTKL